MTIDSANNSSYSEIDDNRGLRFLTPFNQAMVKGALEEVQEQIDKKGVDINKRIVSSFFFPETKYPPVYFALTGALYAPGYLSSAQGKSQRDKFYPIFQLLLNNPKTDLNKTLEGFYPDSDRGFSILHWAARHANYEVLLEILNTKRVDLNAQVEGLDPYTNHCTPLDLAASNLMGMHQTTVAEVANWLVIYHLLKVHGCKHNTRNPPAYITTPPTTKAGLQDIVEKLKAGVFVKA